MLVKLYNLPAHFNFPDIKALIQSTCGISEVIMDNLALENNKKKVTLGLALEEDVAIVKRILHGYQVYGSRLSVEVVGGNNRTANEPENQNRFQRPTYQPQVPSLLGLQTPQSLLQTPYGMNQYAYNAMAQQVPGMVSYPNYYASNKQSLHHNYGFQPQVTPSFNNAAAQNPVQQAKPSAWENKYQNQQGYSLYGQNNSNNQSHGSDRSRDFAGGNDRDRGKNNNRDRNSDRDRNNDRDRNSDRDRGSDRGFQQNQSVWETPRNNYGATSTQGSFSSGLSGLQDSYKDTGASGTQRAGTSRWDNPFTPTDNRSNYDNATSNRAKRNFEHNFDDPKNKKAKIGGRFDKPSQNNQVPVWDNNKQNFQHKPFNKNDTFQNKNKAFNKNDNFQNKNKPFNKNDNYKNKKKPFNKNDNFQNKNKPFNKNDKRGFNKNEPSNQNDPYRVRNFPYKNEPFPNKAQPLFDNQTLAKPVKKPFKLSKKQIAQGMKLKNLSPLQLKELEKNRGLTYRYQAAATITKDMLTKAKLREYQDIVDFKPALKYAVVERINEICGENYTIPLFDIAKMYRLKYNIGGDSEFLKKVAENMAKIAEDIEAKEPGATRIPLHPGTPSRVLAEIASKLPKYPMADKRIAKLLKRQNRMIFENENLIVSKLSNVSQTALEAELDELRDKIINSILDEDKSLGETTQDNRISEITQALNKALKINISKRILDSGPIIVRVFANPKYVTAERLSSLLMPHGVVSIRKTEKRGSVMFIATCETYEQHDKLVTMEPIIINNTTVKCKPFQLVGVKPKIKRSDQELHRLIEYRRVVKPLSKEKSNAETEDKVPDEDVTNDPVCSNDGEINIQDKNDSDGRNNDDNTQLDVEADKQLPDENQPLVNDDGDHQPLVNDDGDHQPLVNDQPNNDKHDDNSRKFNLDLLKKPVIPNIDNINFDDLNDDDLEDY